MTGLPFSISFGGCSSSLVVADPRELLSLAMARTRPGQGFLGGPSRPFFHSVGVEELGRPRRSHKPEIAGSNPAPATSIPPARLPTGAMEQGRLQRQRGRSIQLHVHAFQSCGPP